MSSLSPSPMSSMLRVSNNLNDFDNTLKSIVSAVNEKLESIAAVPDAPRYYYCDDDLHIQELRRTETQTEK